MKAGGLQTALRLQMAQYSSITTVLFQRAASLQLAASHYQQAVSAASLDHLMLTAITSP
jgi:hypothetical protein